jgi:hypothetical protein
VFISTVRQSQAAAERKGSAAEESEGACPNDSGLHEKIMQTVTNFVERYRCLPEGESQNRVSMDRLQSGSFFMIPCRRGGNAGA